MPQYKVVIAPERNVLINNEIEFKEYCKSMRDYYNFRKLVDEKRKTDAIEAYHGDVVKFLQGVLEREITKGTGLECVLKLTYQWCEITNDNTENILDDIREITTDENLEILSNDEKKNTTNENAKFIKENAKNDKETKFQAYISPSRYLVKIASEMIQVMDSENQLENSIFLTCLLLLQLKYNHRKRGFWWNRLALNIEKKKKDHILVNFL